MKWNEDPTLIVEYNFMFGNHYSTYTIGCNKRPPNIGSPFWKFPPMFWTGEISNAAMASTASWSAEMPLADVMEKIELEATPVAGTRLQPGSDRMSNQKKRKKSLLIKKNNNKINRDTYEQLMTILN